MRLGHRHSARWTDSHISRTRIRIAAALALAEMQTLVYVASGKVVALGGNLERHVKIAYGCIASNTIFSRE